MPDIICMCGHGPHTNKPCIQITTAGVCGCQQWNRVDLTTARALVNINNFLMQEWPALMQSLVDILSVLCEQFPDAEQRVVAAREKRRKEKEDANSTAAGASETEGRQII